MYGKVQARHRLLREAQMALHTAPESSEEQAKRKWRRKWRQETEMANVVSEEAEEKQTSDWLGLSIQPHRVPITKTWRNDCQTIEDRFRNQLGVRER